MQRGQSMVELVVALPIVLLLSLAIIQLIWIAWWQLNLGYAVAFSARAGSITGASQTVLERTLVAAMAATGWPAGLDGEAAKSEARLQAALLRANLSKWIQFQQFGRLIVVTPTAAQQQQYQQRPTTKQNKRPHIPIDHARIRYQQASDPEAWLAARQLKIAVTWCIPLRVPLLGGWLARWSRASHSAQAFCQLRAPLSQHPLWPLERTLTTPMQSDFMIR